MSATTSNSTGDAISKKIIYTHYDNVTLFTSSQPAHKPQNAGYPDPGPPDNTHA